MNALKSSVILIVLLSPVVLGAQDPRLPVARQPGAMVVTALIHNEGSAMAFSVPYMVFRKQAGDWVEVRRGTISGIHPGAQQQASFGLPRSPLGVSFKLEAGQGDARQSVVIHVDAEGYL